jgi:hypothetical protein
MIESGRNHTPDKLTAPAPDGRALSAALRRRRRRLCREACPGRVQGTRSHRRPHPPPQPCQPGGQPGLGRSGGAGAPRDGNRTLTTDDISLLPHSPRGKMVSRGVMGKSVSMLGSGPLGVRSQAEASPRRPDQHACQSRDRTYVRCDPDSESEEACWSPSFSSSCCPPCSP